MAAENNLAVVVERLEPGRDSVVFDTASGPLTVDREGTACRMDRPAKAAVMTAVPDELRGRHLANGTPSASDAPTQRALRDA